MKNYTNKNLLDAIGLSYGEFVKRLKESVERIRKMR